MLNKFMKRGHRKVPKPDDGEFGDGAPGRRGSDSVSVASVVVNHSSIGTNSVQSPAPVTIETLPRFRDVPASEQQNLFLRKLQICFFQFEFKDMLKMMREKDIKRQTLVELIEFIQSGSGKICESNQEELIKMISINIFRCLPWLCMRPRDQKMQTLKRMSPILSLHGHIYS
nr:serine/threonine protein phosphatase 2A 57 kDa regulatory subunit B' beta isoform-like [Ipomoea batatas]